MCETWKVTDDWDTTLNAQIHWLNITNSWLSRHHCSTILASVHSRAHMQLHCMHQQMTSDKPFLMSNISNS